MSQKIIRADLSKDGQKVTVEFSSTKAQQGGSILEEDNKLVTHKPAHQDLVNAFLVMIPHLMFTCELAEPDTFRPEWFDNHEFLDDARFEGITVTGIQFIGKEQDAVRLLGRKTTTYGDVIPLNGVIIRLEQEGERKYALNELLKEHLTTWLSEVKAYLKGKYGDGAQMELQIAS